MIVLYNTLILLARISVRAGALFHKKTRTFVSGRKDVLEKLEAHFVNKGAPVVWVHCASLGEFEQGRPVMEALKKEFPALRILLTFFSPSGFEVRKNYDRADFVCYLPWDTASNATRLVAAANPVMAIFVKYEFWHHYSSALKNKNIPLLSISTIFREGQLFFKSYGGFYRNILRNFTHFFVQNQKSLDLLESIAIENRTLAGDTRFDRVYDIVKQADTLPVAGNFKDEKTTFVVGSCWPTDFEVLLPFINENTLKFIIAPHEISEGFLSAMESSLQVKSIRYSQTAEQSLTDYSVLIIDNVGMLSRLYRYGEFAFVGGAFGDGLHNILEAACYGMPIFFGNKNYTKFQEATDLINRGGAFEVKDYADLKSKYEIVSMPESFLLACDVTRQYVSENLGATEKIMRYSRKLITS